MAERLNHKVICNVHFHVFLCDTVMYKQAAKKDNTGNQKPHSLWCAALTKKYRMYKN